MTQIELAQESPQIKQTVFNFQYQSLFNITDTLGQLFAGNVTNFDRLLICKIT